MGHHIGVGIPTNRPARRRTKCTKRHWRTDKQQQTIIKKRSYMQPKFSSRNQWAKSQKLELSTIEEKLPNIWYTAEMTSEPPQRKRVGPWSVLRESNRIGWKEREQRLNICRECDKLIKATFQCSECGCFMKIKTRIKDAECPIGKWWAIVARLPELFNCVVCGLPIRPKDGIAERKAIVWLKSSGISISRVVEELHEYKHSMCSDKDDVSVLQDQLF